MATSLASSPVAQAAYTAGYVISAATSDPRCPATIMYLGADNRWYRRRTTLVNARGWRAYFGRKFPGMRTRLILHPQDCHRPDPADVAAAVADLA